MNTKKNAQRRREIHNKNTKEAPIKIGTRVLVRNRVLGRNKIQDTWSSVPYKVIARPGENVYSIQLADRSGPRRNVTRTEEVEADSDSDSDSDVIVDQAMDITPQQETLPITPQQETLPIGDEGEDDDTGGNKEEEVPDETEESRPRRSGRQTAGKHSNPFHLLKSVLASNQEVRASPTDVKDFRELSDAIANLGASLRSSLRATLSQSWANIHVQKQ